MCSKVDPIHYLGVFGNKQPREIAELINGLYVEEFDNLLTSLKKLFKENSHALDINQTGSMMRATVRFWNILPTLHKVYTELCHQGASHKLPEFLNKYEQILTMTENFIDKQLQAIEGRLDKISKDHLSLSAIDEVSRNLSELHYFYASAQPSSKSMFFATKHSLLYPLRPFMNLSTRLLADKNNTNTLLYGIQVISRLQQLSKTTVLADSAPDFFQKMTKQLLDSMGIIASGLAQNIQETIKKQPDDIKRQVLLLALLPDSSNPNFSAFKTIKLIKEKAAKRHLAEEYHQNLVDLVQKVLPKDKDLINSLNRTPISEFLAEENIQFN